MEATVYFTGIDLHKRTIVLHTVDEVGEFVRKSRVKANRGALLGYFGALSGHHRVVLESTIGWYWASDALRSAGVDVVLAHAAKLKAIAEAKVKTDSVDAATMAQLLRVGLMPVAYQMEPERRAERDLLRSRLRLIERRTSCLNSIDRVLEKFNVKLVRELPELYQCQVRSHATQAALLERQIAEIERTLRPRLKECADLNRLSRLPGIGLINSQTILLETGEISRFAKDRHYFSYCRLVPGADNSALRIRHRSSHKAGNRYLKLAFSHAAVRAIQHYPEIRAVYQKRRRRKPKQVARAYIAKELARIAYCVLKNQKDFDGRFKGIPLRRRKAPDVAASGMPQSTAG